jgi:hypothetical protein
MIDMPALVRRIRTEDSLELLLFIGDTDLKLSTFFFKLGFRIQGNVDMFPHRESPRIFIVPCHSEIFPLEASCSGKSHSGIRTGFICEVYRTEEFNMKKNRLFHGANSETSMDLEHVASDLFDLSTLEKIWEYFPHRKNLNFEYGYLWAQCG